jgi:hypothetical protein
MSRNNLTTIFSQVCQHIADNMQELLLPNLNDSDLMITPLFEDAHITDIDDWWNRDNHFKQYITQVSSLESDAPGSMQENMENGLGEVQESETLWAQLRALDDGSEEAQLEALKYIPHNAQYASGLMETDGYKALDRICDTIGDIVVWPMITINTEATNLKSAFYLNVAIVSTDDKPLKAKLESFRKLTF